MAFPIKIGGQSIPEVYVKLHLLRKWQAKLGSAQLPLAPPAHWSGTFVFAFHFSIVAFFKKVISSISNQANKWDCLSLDDKMADSGYNHYCQGLWYTYDKWQRKQFLKIPLTLSGRRKKVEQIRFFANKQTWLWTGLRVSQTGVGLYPCAWLMRCRQLFP